MRWTEFVIASVAIVLLPGPGQMAILAAVFAEGRRAGLKAVAGLLTGDILIMSGTALGVSVVFGAVPSLVQAIRIAGGLALVWIGWGVLRRPFFLQGQGSIRPGRNWYVRTVGITLLNPKAILFFVSFFPAFLPAAGAPSTWFPRMGALFTAISGSYLVFFTWAGSHLAAWMERSPRGALLVGRVLGGVVVLFGVKMLL